MSFIFTIFVNWDNYVFMDSFVKIRQLFLISGIFAIFFSCNPNEDLSPETILEFKGYRFFGDSTSLTGLEIEILFQNGKGNLGLRPEEVGPPFVGKYRNNFFVHVFDKESLFDTVFVPLQTLETIPQDVVFPYRIPILSDRPGHSVRGTLKIDIKGANFLFMQMASKHKRVRFEVYMVDRDLNYSYVRLANGEVVQGHLRTPEISISE